MNPTLAFKPKDAFGTAAAYLEFLRGEGFTLKTAEPSVVEANWAALAAPLSSTFADPQKSHYCFHLKNGELAPGWGLVLRSLKNKSALASNEIGVDAPEAAFDLLLRKLAPPEWLGDKSNGGNCVAQYSQVACEDGVVIGPGCEFGAGVKIEAGARIGARVRVGDGTRIGAGSRIADDTIIGNNCYFRGQVSIGGQGFGFIPYPNSPIPRHRLHVGRVVIGDGVRLGSFVSIDRGVLEDTVVGAGCATDNVVQIGHNCRLGKNNILCGFVALAGSTILGDYVTLGGLVVTKGHLRVGDGVQVGGWSGIYEDLPAGALVRGCPTRPIRQDLKIMAIQDKLPELYSLVKNLVKSQGSGKAP